jgi:hypothetical protein
VEFEWFGGPDPLWHSTWGREPRWITRRGFPLDGALLSFSRPPCSHSHNATGPGFPCRGRFRHRKRTPLPFAAAQTRIFSVATIWLVARKSARPFKGIIFPDVSEFESFSIGAGWCQALSDCSVNLMWDVTRRVRASLRARHLGPPMMGSGGCGGPIYRGILAVRLTAGIRTRNGLASSIVPCGDIAPPVGGIHVSPVVFLLCTTGCEIRHDERQDTPLMPPQLLPWSSETRCHPSTCDA